jgi:hypothetical protein
LSKDFFSKFSGALCKNKSLNKNIVTSRLRNILQSPDKSPDKSPDESPDKSPDESPDKCSNPKCKCYLNNAQKCIICNELKKKYQGGNANLKKLYKKLKSSNNN